MSRALARQPKMPSTASSASSTDCSLSESKRNEMSYEERQAAYLEARNRIFAATASSAETSTTGESTAGSTTSSSGQLKKNKTADSKLLAAKLRPSATSFDPRAKAHGYEEVTVIEVDDHSITLPYPSDPSSPPSSSDDDALRDPSADPASSSSSSSTTTAPIAAAVAHLTLASPGPPASPGPRPGQHLPARFCHQPLTNHHPLPVKPQWTDFAANPTADSI
ncbi:hypothetical protein PtB15_16B282 [Puccinia triticina]|nr:hypothetical protein PtB15_16B282 [Puccinia triticina]